MNAHVQFFFLLFSSECTILLWGILVTKGLERNSSNETKIIVAKGRKQDQFLGSSVPARGYL